MPEFAAQPVAKVIAVVHADIDVSYGPVVFFQADGVVVSTDLTVFALKPFFVKGQCFLSCFYREPWEEFIDPGVTEDVIHSIQIVFRELS